MSEEVEYTEDERGLLAYGHVFYQLLKFPWFKDMFECQFDIQKIVDDETKTINITVIEVPPEIASDRMKKLSEERAKELDERIVAPSSDDIRTVTKFKL